MDAPVGYVIVSPKICELCGRMFFRAAAERECKPCAATLAAEPVAIPDADAPEETMYWQTRGPKPVWVQ